MIKYAESNEIIRDLRKKENYDYTGEQIKPWVLKQRVD